MDKKHRIWFPGAIYHIICREKWNNAIYFERSDYVSYLSALESIRYQYPFYLHCYCLTKNEIQLLIETIHVHINDIVTNIHYHYFKVYRQRYHCEVLYFHNEYYLIDSVETFLKTSKTIHLLPASIKVNPATYHWSSYISFISNIPNDHVVTSRILKYFPNPKLESYRRYVEEEAILIL